MSDSQIAARSEFAMGGRSNLGNSSNPDLSWQERALCAQTDPEAFFPEKGGSTREAKRVCLSCDVRSECLEYALGHDERFGREGAAARGREVRVSAARLDA